MIPGLHQARIWTARIASRLDPVLLGLLLLLMALSLAVLFSASGGRESVVIAQGVRFGIGLTAMLAIAQIAPTQLRTWSPWLYLASLGLLALVPVFGSGRSGQHWLDLGVFYLQPGELLKLSVPMMLAWLLHRAVLPPTPAVLLAGLALIGLPTLMIAIQPDLGTAVPVAASGVLAIFLAGLSWRWIAGLGLAGLASAPLAWLALKDYQKQRILTFIDPESDPLGSGWNIIQSKIAVGSGGLFGKGWTAGSQARLEFLPEQTTDFIFAVLAEEFGLAGVLFALLLYLAILGRCLWIAAESRDGFGRLVVGALGLTFFLYVVLNGGMIAGLLPVVGVPMPLLSFGGTSALAFLAGFGLVMSVHSHRRLLGH